MEIRGPAPSATGGERPPGYALPVGIPCEGVALHTGGRAVWIGSLRAFPNGFDFVLRSVRAPGLSPAGPLPGAHELPLSVAYSDGSAARGPGACFPATVAGNGPPAVTLLQLGGSGNATVWEARYWVHPLPPDGPVTVTVADAESGAGSVVFNGAVIRAAAAECEQLWPEEDFDDTGGGGAWSSAFTG